MSYVYSEWRRFAFTEKGQVTFLAIRDRAQKLMREAEAATMGALISGQAGLVWEMQACVDRLVELGELLEIPNPISRAGQHRIFIAPYREP
jgi:hypothetical protein